MLEKMSVKILENKDILNNFARYKNTINFFSLNCKIIMLKRKYIALLGLVVSFFACFAEEKEEIFYIYFEPGKSDYNAELGTNRATLENGLDLIESAFHSDSLFISKIYISGLTSPEGSAELNEELALNRQRTMYKLLSTHHSVSPWIVEFEDKETYPSGIAWKQLREWVAETDMQQKEAVISIIDSEGTPSPYCKGKTIDSRVKALMALDGGEAWKRIHNDYFDRMRSGLAVIVTNELEDPEDMEVAKTTIVVPEEPAPETVVQAEIVEETAEIIEEPDWKRRILLKTNAVGWALANANIAGEIDLGRHFSFTLPIYYSAMNYFTYKVKFRSLGIQPEFRYWFKPENDRWFIGAHFGMAYYNVALNGDYRYQDHDGKTPALGGGIAAGYRMPISRNGRWKVEFTVGAGAYRLHYDKFVNEPNGPLVGSKKKTYIGLDQFQVGFSYTFPLK